MICPGAPATLAEFQPHSKETVWAIAEHVSKEANTLNKTALQKLAQKLGFNHLPGGLLLNMRLRQFLDPVGSTFIDPAHTFTASGGAAQYQVNEFIRHAIALPDMSLRFMDDFSQRIKWPRSCSTISKTW